MSNSEIIARIQSLVDEIVDPEENGITIMFSVSERVSDRECISITSFNTFGQCGCSRSDFKKEVEKFILKLEAIDSSFNCN